jgi:hypothetical protein
MAKKKLSGKKKLALQKANAARAAKNTGMLLFEDVRGFKTSANSILKLQMVVLAIKPLMMVISLKQQLADVVKMLKLIITDNSTIVSTTGKYS